MGDNLSTRLRELLSSPWLGAAFVTLLTVVLVGAVVLVVTPAGCGLGFHFGANRCANQAARIVITTTTPTPTIYVPSAQPIPSPQPPPTTAPVPTPTHDPALPPYAYPASGVPSPEFADASASLPASLGLNCRLPIYAGSPGSGGFLVFPDRTFIADPRSAVSVPSPSPATFAPGVVPAFFGLTYDKAFDRWLPVPWRWVTPDGKRYAFPTPDGIYVVDVTSGALTELGKGRSWTVLDVDVKGVYAIPDGAGLWLLPFSGAPAQLSATGFWQGVGGGYAYGTSTSQVPQGVADTILRLDLQTNATQAFFEVVSSYSFLVGFDGANNPIFESQGPGPTQFWWVPAAGEAQVISTNGAINQPVTGDAHGAWLMNQQLIYLFVPGQGTYDVAVVGGLLAGGCA